MAAPRGKPAEPAPSEEEARELAGYGPAPEGYLGAPAYALRVRQRQKELTARIAEVNERLKKAEAERDGAEAQIGQAAVDFGLVKEGAEELESKVAEAERSISAAKGRKTHEEETYDREMARINGEIEELAQQIAPRLDRQQTIDEEVRTAEAARQRAEARVKRVDIELRNIEGALAKGTIDPATAEARTIEAQSQRVALEREVHARAAEHARTQAEQGRMRSELSPSQRKMQALEKERGRLTAEHEERVGAYSAHARLASNWRRSRLAVIGRRLYEMDPRPRLLDGERLFGRIDQSRQKVATVQAELEQYLRAMDAYDEEALTKAKHLLMAASGVVGILLFAALLYSC